MTAPTLIQTASAAYCIWQVIDFQWTAKNPLLYQRRLSESWSTMPIDPSFGEIDDEPFRIVAVLEAFRQAGDALRETLTIGLPGNLCARAPLLVALVKRSEGDD